MERMDRLANVQQFLTSRRAELKPSDVGLPDYGGRRRVPGLRREEVALIAGISNEYYIRIERGLATGVSPAVFAGLCRALCLTDLEAQHLRQLLSPDIQDSAGSQETDLGRDVHPELLRLLNAMATVPAIVQNRRLDIVATNPMGAFLYQDVFDDPAASLPKYIFLDDRSRTFFADWEAAADLTVAQLRSKAGQYPLDSDLTGLVATLQEQSEPFARMWSKYRVQDHQAGSKTIIHPRIGELTLTFETMEPQRNRDLTLTAYCALPGSDSDRKLSRARANLDSQQE